MIKITPEDLVKMKDGDRDAAYTWTQKILHNYLVWASILIMIPFFVMISSFGRIPANVADPLLTPTPTRAIVLSTPVPRDGDGRRIGVGTPTTSTIPALGLSIAPSGQAMTVLQKAQSTVDQEPPRTQILYPLPGTVLTTATGGKACIIFSPLYDNKSKSENIALTYSFDSGLAHTINGAGAACADAIYNGTHLFTYYLVDEAGNRSDSRPFQFTMRIPGFDMPTATPIPPTMTLTPTLTKTPTPTPSPTPNP
ncbi:MAG: hypothetical protein WCO78_05360 [Candidatus Roizmanbacteria bacterium]